MHPTARKSVVMFHLSGVGKNSAQDEQNRCGTVCELPLSERPRNQDRALGFVALGDLLDLALKPEDVTSIPEQEIPHYRATPRFFHAWSQSPTKMP